MRHTTLSIVLMLFLASCTPSPDLISEWHHPLYNGLHGFWKQRIPVMIHNNTDLDLAGDPLVVEVGKGGDKIPLKGAMAEAIRVTNQHGKQMMYRLDAPDGNRIEVGIVPGGTVLTIPVECLARDTVTYFIYSDNTEAWPVGEYFYTHREVSNGGFEKTGPYGPLGWELEWPEDNRDVSWSDAESHSGQRSVKLSADQAGEEVAVSGWERFEEDGSKPVSIYGAIQENIHLLPGLTYTIEAWFKAENMEGEAGLMVLPKSLERNKRDIKIDTFRIDLEQGSFDWKRKEIEFTAPEESNILVLSTFMEGTGTFWMDDVRVTCDFDYDIRKEVLAKRSAPVTESGRTERWYTGTDDREEWPLRASIVVPNYSDNHLEDQPVYVDIQQLLHRLHADVDEKTLMLVTSGTEPIPHLRRGNALLFRQDIPAYSVQTFYLYFSEKGNTTGITGPETYPDLEEINENLIVNPGFDDAGGSGWERFGEIGSKVISIAEEDGNPVLMISYAEGEDREAARDLFNEVAEVEEDIGTGIYQTFAVESGRSYFFSASAKSSNVLGWTSTLRARFINEEGELTGPEETLNMNPEMHADYAWEEFTMIFEAPEDVSSVSMELLNTAAGKIWYDDVFLMSAANGSTGAMALERKAAADLEELACWQQNPIVKVFPDDLPKASVDKFTLTAARNEVEPIQVAFRSPTAYENLEIQVIPPTNSEGQILEDVETGVVGYVPVGYPSNFYGDAETMFWQTKMPSGPIRSDGWTGWWPDPVLPVQSFDLPPHHTTAAWIEISVPEDASPGDYTGSIRLIHKGSILKEFPLEMRIYDFVLPESSGIATFDVFFNNREMFGRKNTEQENIEELWHFMKEHRIAPGTINPQPEFSLVEGEVKVDFTKFDRAAKKFFDDLKFQTTWTPLEFFLFWWGIPPQDFLGVKPYDGISPYPGVDRSKLRPEYVELFKSALSQYWAHMKEMGWADRVILYLSDEPGDDHDMVSQARTICDIIHDVDPDIPIYISTWYYRPKLEGYVDVWGVSHRGGGWGHPVPVEHLEKIRKNGGEIFFTTDGMVCTDTPYIGFERLITYYCYKYGATKYENWAANWHTLDPYRYGWHSYFRQYGSVGYGGWARYPNGSGKLIFPGPPVGVDQLVATIRVKQIREGVEDYEYMDLLSRLIERSGAEGRDTQTATEALNRALDLVDIPSADGPFTTRFISDPDAILEIRNAMAEAIEELSSHID